MKERVRTSGPRCPRCRRVMESPRECQAGICITCATVELHARGQEMTAAGLRDLLQERAGREVSEVKEILCERCGKPVPRKASNQRYCTPCGHEVRKEQIQAYNLMRKDAA